MHILNIAEAI